MIKWLLIAGASWILWSRITRKRGIPGGLAEGMDASQFDPAEVAAGILVEMEHTNDPVLAQEITLDHLAENPAYYQLLARAGL